MKVRAIDLKDPFTVTVLLCLCFVIVLFARSIYTVSPELGGDALRKWITAKALADTGSLIELIEIRHHSARWGVNFPLTVLIKISGYNITNYILLPIILYAGIFTLFISFAIKKPFHMATLFALVIFLFYEPMFFRASAQPQPFIFGVFYLTVALWSMNRYLERQHLLYLFVSALFLFFAYGAKETYLFFFSGFYVLLLMRGRFKDCIILSLFLLSFLAIETLVFNALSDGLKLGRVEYLAKGNHLKAMAKKASFGGYSVWDFLTRRWFAIGHFNQFVSAVSILYMAFAAATKRISKMDNLTLGVFLISLSYCFILTCVPYKLDPLLSIQPLLEKYMTPMMPFFVYCTIYALNDCLQSLKGSKQIWASRIIIIATAGFLAFSIIWESPLRYFHRFDYPAKDAFIWKQDQYIENFNAKWDDGYGFCVTRWKVHFNIKFWLRHYLDQKGPGRTFEITKVNGLRVFHSPNYTANELKGYIRGTELAQILAVELCDMSKLD